MRFHQKFGLSFIPLPSCYVEVAEGRVRHLRFGRTLANYDLKETTATFRPRGLSGFLHGYGEVKLKEESKSDTAIDEVIRGAALRQFIDTERAKLEREADARAETKAQQQEEAAPRAPPPGTKFSREMAKLPPLPQIFEWELWNLHLKLQGGTGRSCPQPQVSYGEWVDRGDPLCSYLMKGYGRQTEIFIRSPVSGLVIDSLQPNFGRPWGAILLPEGEPEPDPIDYPLGDLLMFCFDNREYIFTELDRSYRKSREFVARLHQEYESLRAAAWTIEDISANLSDAEIDDLVRSRPYLREPLEKLNPEGSGRESQAGSSLTAPPARTRFGRKVLLLPALSPAFDRAFRISVHSSQQIARAQYGSWIERGQELCSFPMNTSAMNWVAGAPHVSIQSPASGLLLDGFFDWSRPDGWAAILLPENEPAPMPMREVVGPLSVFCRNHFTQLYRSGNATGGGDMRRHYEGGDPLGEFSRQESLDYLVVDIAQESAEPGRARFLEHIVTLMDERPQLRPFLRDLVESDGAETAPPSSPMNDQRTHTVFEAELERDNEADIRAARERFGLGQEFSRDELDRAYRKRIAAIHASLFEQCNDDYQRLMSVAS